MSDYDIESVSIGSDADVELSLLVNGTRFYINFRAADLRDDHSKNPERFEQELLALIKDIDDEFDNESDQDQDGVESSEDEMGDLDDEHDEEEHCSVSDCHSSHDHCCTEHHEDPIERWTLQPFIRHQIFEKYAPQSSTPLFATLNDYIHKRTLSFTLKSINGDLVPVEIPTKTETLSWFVLPARIDDAPHWSECAQVLPSELALTNKSHPQDPRMVLYEGKTCFFKSIDKDIENEVYVREIDSNMRIIKAGLADKVRIPRLRALVMVPGKQEQGYIHGMLFDAVAETATLLSRQATASIALRRRWFNEVSKMLELLHAEGIVWGDFKPENMLIDKEDNLWLIDFGGGATDSWVDDEYMETVKGDLQGLNRLRSFMKLR